LHVYNYKYIFLLEGVKSSSLNMNRPIGDIIRKIIKLNLEKN